MYSLKYLISTKTILSSAKKTTFIQKKAVVVFALTSSSKRSLSDPRISIENNKSVLAVAQLQKFISEATKLCFGTSESISRKKSVFLKSDATRE